MGISEPQYFSSVRKNFLGVHNTLRVGGFKNLTKGKE